MKNLKKIGWLVLIIFVIAQFFNPQKNEGDITATNAFIAETNPPENVVTILKTSCFDCHSNFTRYPWYNRITPVNFWLEDHIKGGKKHLNFSEFSKYTLKKKEHKMEELHEEVAKKNMPFYSYKWTHFDAHLSQDQIDAVVSWAKQVQMNYKQQLEAK